MKSKFTSRVSATYAPCILALWLLLITQTSIVSANTFKSINELSHEFEQKHGIKLYWHHSQGKPAAIIKLGYLYAEEHDQRELENYLQNLDEEFSKYPRSFHKATKLKAIAVVKYLNISGYSGTFQQKRSAVPDYDAEVLYYDFKYGSDRMSYQKNVIHHEYYHMIEEEINGDVYWKDPEWSKFNTPEHRYGDGGAWAQNKPTYATRLNYPKKGFIDFYSTTGIEEDKASIYAALMIEKENKTITSWMKKDQALKNKILYMKDFIESLQTGLIIKLHHSG